MKESGTHAQLMEKRGGYAGLYLAQKSLEEGYKAYAAPLAWEAL